MSYRSNVAAIACLSVIGMGITGCGSSNKTVADKPVDPEQPVVVIPGYAQPAVVNEKTTKAALNALNDDMGMHSKNKKNTNSISSTINAKAIDKMKSLKIADSAYGAQGREDEESIDITMDCAYSGSFHLVSEWSDNGPQESGTGEITFDNCIHSESLLDGIGILVNDTGSERFVHSGSIRVEYSDTEMNNVYQGADGMSAVNLSMVVNVDDVKVYELAANGEMSYSDYESNSVYREEEAINGTLSMTKFAPDGTSAGFAIEGNEFNAKYAYEDSSSSMILNGYLSLTETEGEDMYNKYIYGEAFTATYSSENMESANQSGETLTNETYNGVLGTDCIGGTVTFATSASWDTNSSQVDIGDYEGGTPFAGATTISGAEGSSAAVNFASDDSNISFGTITIDGVESDPMARSQMSDGACEDSRP